MKTSPPSQSCHIYCAQTTHFFPFVSLSYNTYNHHEGHLQCNLVFNVGRTTHTTPLLCELHWLPIPQRIQFKLCLHIHKIITNSAPEYLSNCISLYKPSRALRSSQDTTRLQIPRSNYSFSANRFGVTAPKAWNIIPQHIREMTSTPLFKQHLKTYLFPNC